MDCERRLLHGQKNALASAKARPNTLWMYCPVQPWILQLNWARNPPPVVLGIVVRRAKRYGRGPHGSLFIVEKLHERYGLHLETIQLRLAHAALLPFSNLYDKAISNT